jgi:hypothetical protein
MTPRSSSCGPKFARDLGKASVKRERNMTMNYNKLLAARPNSRERVFSRLNWQRTRQYSCRLTAISGLSANTYSWGGEGSLSGGGGEVGWGAGAAGTAFEKNRKMPSFFTKSRLLSSSDGTDESSEDSSEDMALLWLLVEGFVCLKLGNLDEVSREG